MSSRVSSRELTADEIQPQAPGVLPWNQPLPASCLCPAAAAPTPVPQAKAGVSPRPLLASPPVFGPLADPVSAVSTVCPQADSCHRLRTAASVLIILAAGRLRQAPVVPAEAPQPEKFLRRGLLRRSQGFPFSGLKGSPPPGPTSLTWTARPRHALCLPKAAFSSSLRYLQLQSSP